MILWVVSKRTSMSYELVGIVYILDINKHVRGLELFLLIENNFIILTFTPRKLIIMLVCLLTKIHFNNNNNNIYYLRCQLHITVFYDTSQAILYEAYSIKTQFIHYDR